MPAHPRTGYRAGVSLLDPTPAPEDPERLILEASRTCDRLRSLSLVRLAAPLPGRSQSGSGRVRPRPGAGRRVVRAGGATPAGRLPELADPAAGDVLAVCAQDLAEEVAERRGDASARGLPTGGRGAHRPATGAVTRAVAPSGPIASGRCGGDLASPRASAPGSGPPGPRAAGWRRSAGSPCWRGGSGPGRRTPRRWPRTPGPGGRRGSPGSPRPAWRRGAVPRPATVTSPEPPTAAAGRRGARSPGPGRCRSRRRCPRRRAWRSPSPDGARPAPWARGGSRRWPR